MFKSYVYDYTQTTVEPICFFSNTAIDSKLKIGEAKLTLAENAAGSFEFTLTRNNIANDHFKTVSSIVEVYKDSDIFWRGRVLSEERDIYDRRKIVCEGGLNFLMDSIQYPMHVNCGILSWLQYLLVNEYHDPDSAEGQYHHCHNYFYTSTETFKRVNIKYFDPSIELEETVDWYADYETTLELVNNVIEAYNLKMEVTYENGLINLSFYKDYPLALRSHQSIMFGRNLIDYTRNWTIEDLATVIIPKGKKYDNEDERPAYPYTPPDLDAVRTIESVNSGSAELEADSDVIARYGKIYKTIDWSDIEDPANLLDLAQNYFTNYQFDKMTIEVQLYDLSLLMTGSEKQENELHLLGEVRCVSKPHGLDRYFPITQIEYDLNNLGSTQYTLGTVDSSSTLSGGTANATGELKEEIKKSKLQESKIFNDVIGPAMEHADTLMHNFAQVGHVSFTRNSQNESQVTGIVISDKVNWSDNDACLWMWNQGGLAWSEDGGRTFTGVSITNDGQINASFITAGILNAGIIRAGTLKDIYENIKWDLETGVLNAKDFTLETMSGPDTYGYLFLSSDIWKNKSVFYDPSGINQVTIASHVSDSWKLIVGRFFGVDFDGTASCANLYIGGFPSAITHKVVNSAINTPATNPQDDDIQLTVDFAVMSNLYPGILEPPLAGDSTHLAWRWIFCYDLEVGDEVADNIYGPGYAILATVAKQTTYTNQALAGTVDFSTKRFTKQEMLDCDASHYRIEYYISQDGFLRQNSFYGAGSEGFYDETISSDMQRWSLIAGRQGYLMTGDVANGDVGSDHNFFIGSMTTGELFGTDWMGNYSIAETARNDWVLSVGKNFGVTVSGVVYSADGHFKRATVDGSITAQDMFVGTVGQSPHSLVFSGTVAEQTATTYTDEYVIGVASVSGTAYRTDVTVYAYFTIGTGRVKPQMTIRFYLGWWTGALLSYDSVTDRYRPHKDNQEVDSWWTAANFARANGSTSYSITIPSSMGGTGNRVTKTISIPNTNLAYSIMEKNTYDSVSRAKPADKNWPDTDNHSFSWTDSPDQLSAVFSNCSFAPSNSGTFLLGGVGKLWKQVYASTATIYTSARQRKYDITQVGEDFDIFFDNLKPSTFRMKQGDTGRRHAGFVLDEVGEALRLADIPSDDFAGYIAFNKKDELADGGLRYSEFIAINTDQIQKLKKRVSELEALVEELERARNED